MTEEFIQLFLQYFQELSSVDEEDDDDDDEDKNKKVGFYKRLCIYLVQKYNTFNYSKRNRSTKKGEQQANRTNKMKQDRQRHIYTTTYLE